MEEEVKRFFDRPLEDEFIYLFLDGIVMKVREVSRSVKRIVLVAYGIRADGSRELIDFRMGKHEGKGSWTSFLQNLQVRGLKGSKLKLIISDGCPGLWAATQEVFPFVPHSCAGFTSFAMWPTSAPGSTSKNAPPMLGRSTSPPR